MTRRIFRAICVVAVGVFLSSMALFMGVFYRYFSGLQQGQLRMQADLAAQGVAHEGSGYFQGLDVKDYRITWIDAAGMVLYDSRGDLSEMENHLEREEIRQALSQGSGESRRYSATLLERFFYCARRLPDGTVLRLSIAQSTPLTLLLGMALPVCLIFAMALILSLALAFHLSRAIVKPLNELNLDQPPLNSGEYEELTPLLKRIAQQRRRIRSQEEELKKRQREFEAVTTGMAEGIVLLNERKVILSINPAAMRLLGTDHSCTGKDLLSVNHGLKVGELLEKARGGKHAELLLDMDGKTYQLDASPVFSEGLISGIVLLMLDVTEKEKAEQLRREFTANVSHELKTPMHTISGSAELMANGMVRPEDVPGFARQIYGEAQRMIRLVDDIIRLSHLDEGPGDMKWEEVDLYALAGETMETLLPQAETAGVQMNLGGEPVMVRGVRPLLQSIVFNLCDNAIKYNRRDGSVMVTVKSEGEKAVLWVADTGIGIPAEHKERIFERFYRVDKSHSKEIGGTGLGLSIVKHGVKLHGGDIEVHSAVNSGTTIKVCFTRTLQNPGNRFDVHLIE